MAVLAAIARRLIQLGVHSTFEEAVEASLRDNAVYAQHCSVVKRRTGACHLSLEHVLSNSAVVHVQLFDLRLAL